jgi:hypothetical protein
VKNYLLPMFNVKRRANSKVTSKIFSSPGPIKQPTTNPLGTSLVMSELQVNQELYQKLILTEQALIDSQEKLEAQ